MIAKSNIRTNLFKGTRFLQNRKTLTTLSFATEQVANRNAEKYSVLLGQPVRVVPFVHNGTTQYFELAVNEFIA